jgi:hypothetical protein
MGYLVPGYYYFSKLEKRHYYSRILKFAITILDFPRICHMKTTRAQLQVYTKTYNSSYFRYTLNGMWAPLVSIFFLLSSPFLLFSCVHRSVQWSGSGGWRGGATACRGPRRGLPRSAESNEGRRRGIPKCEGACQLPGVRRWGPAREKELARGGAPRARVRSPTVAHPARAHPRRQPRRLLHEPTREPTWRRREPPQPQRLCPAAAVDGVALQGRRTPFTVPRHAHATDKRHSTPTGTASQPRRKTAGPTCAQQVSEWPAGDGREGNKDG